MPSSLIVLLSVLLTPISALPTIAGLPSYVARRPVTPLPAICDVATAVQPAATPGLAPPSADLVLSLITIGRGTQNYTCADSSSATVPVSVGAVAILRDASCVAAKYPSQVSGLVTIAESQPHSSLIAALPVVGHHFFTDNTTPFFDVLAWGGAALKRAGSGVGASTAVPWLKLEAVAGQSSRLKEVYRLETRNGKAPATCAGMPQSFTVDYAAEYWFYTTEW